ncbi:hypothetical protein SISSUDRAFT_1062515 [Sistotremastrum suecicum HHB10207 ss-3]|uniref:Uncharacterized protein n=1 Tax=Sistotremastrum suecicum HHB10207 ss-3 TaxID=1314776 RepID=A0A166CVE2_9AGAM|nr:hypothetical protein SISSUDRAFT_1062515 [Sistotremastrum suecicum HHB10207 ss-3]
MLDNLSSPLVVSGTLSVVELDEVFHRTFAYRLCLLVPESSQTHSSVLENLNKSQQSYITIMLKTMLPLSAKVYLHTLLSARLQKNALCDPKLRSAGNQDDRSSYSE